MPQVSVVIPYYNRAATLPRALRSLAAQTFRDFEVIIVDDCSHESPSALIESLDLPFPVKVLRQPKNAGPSACRNWGFDAAQGRFIALLDSDDSWLPEKLERQLAVALAASHPDNVICLAQTTLHWPDRETASPLWNPAQQSLGAFFFISDGIMQTSSFFLSTTLARKVRFEESLRLFEDVLFLFQLKAAGAEFLFLPEKLFYWHLASTDDQLSNATSLEAADRFLALVGDGIDEVEWRAFLVRYVGLGMIRKRPWTFARLALLALQDGTIRPWNLLGLLKRSLTVRFS